jgi:hypothetical protein
MIDTITVERLIAFAAECRQKIQAELLSRYPRYPHVTIDEETIRMHRWRAAR